MKPEINQRHRVLCALQFFPYVTQLTGELRMSDSAVRKHLNKLVDRGFVVVGPREQSRFGFGPAKYTLTDLALAALKETSDLAEAEPPQRPMPIVEQALSQRPTLQTVWGQAS